MKMVLVTGGTGVVGAPIVALLVAGGAQVRCLVRDPRSAATVLPGAELIAGDIEDADQVGAAMAGCDTVFHSAGIPEQWTRDPAIFQRVNCGGTANVLAAMRASGTRRLLHVSTQDTFDLTRDPMDETMPSRDPHPSHYEGSKIAAQKLVDRAGAEGMDVRSIHPCAVYGPGAIRPTGMTALLWGLRLGKVPALLPGGLPVVHNADVAKGALLALEKGAPGSHYILCESYQTLRQMAEAVHARFPDAPLPREMPLWLAKVLAGVGDPLGRLFGVKPMLGKGELSTLIRTGRPSAAKARRELGWTARPFAEGLESTFQ
ncbi:MAG: NAD-dependent epimerase/dehydratase family protein [Sphingomonadaceae bacterium]